MNRDLRLAVPAGFAWIVVGILVSFPQFLPSAAAVLWGCAGAAVCLALLTRRAGLRAAASMMTLAAAAAALILSSAALAAPARM
ncbi:MAG TPA: hypothetical protein VIQ26_08060, partial [Microbacteriaceae bacterium]